MTRFKNHNILEEIYSHIMLNNAFPIEGRGSAMNDYTMVLVIFSAMILKNEPLL
jgi:hypothetical protein